MRALAQGESEPSPLLYQHALRDVIGRCLYGVDINPMAAELCRVSLWLEALEPGKPLSFLDHHIRVGNSLLGTTPELIAAGMPDEAFKPIEGDDKRLLPRSRSRTRASGSARAASSARVGPLGSAGQPGRGEDLARRPGRRHGGRHRKRAQYEALVQGSGYLHGQQLADTWCAAFVSHKQETPEHPSRSPRTWSARSRRAPFTAAIDARGVERLASQYQFFHWHLEFPGGVRAAKGGFDWCSAIRHGSA